MHLINGDLEAEFGPTPFGASNIARTPIEVSIEGSSTLISHLPSALIINHQSVLNSHPTRRCQVCIRLSFAKEGWLRHQENAAKQPKQAETGWFGPPPDRSLRMWNEPLPGAPCCRCLRRHFFDGPVKCLPRRGV